jgi:hypothetical protein
MDIYNFEALNNACRNIRSQLGVIEKAIAEEKVAFKKLDAEQSRLEAMSQEGVETTETKVASELLNEPQ